PLPAVRMPLAVVGQGIGATAALGLLESIRKRPDLPVQPRVVLLAPALDFTRFSGTFGMHSQEPTSLRVFGLKDDLERTDCWVPGLYPRSLLYFISGVLESEPDRPLIGMQRYHLDAPPFDSRSQPEWVAGRVRIGPEAVWAVAHGGPGRRASA